MKRDKLCYQPTVASGPMRMRWTVRELSAHPLLGSLPDAVMRVIARPMSVSQAVALMPGR